MSSSTVFEKKNQKYLEEFIRIFFKILEQPAVKQFFYKYTDRKFVWSKKRLYFHNNFPCIVARVGYTRMLSRILFFDPNMRFQFRPPVFFFQPGCGLQV